MKKSQIQYITSENFARYGNVIDFLPEDEGNFKIIAREPHYGWRVAVYKVEERHVTKLENHPESMESFEPLKGVALLAVARNPEPRNYEVFLLDKPVCLAKGIWHAVVALSEEVQVKITENIEVEILYHMLHQELVPFLGAE